MILIDKRTIIWAVLRETGFPHGLDPFFFFERKKPSSLPEQSPGKHPKVTKIRTNILIKERRHLQTPKGEAKTKAEGRKQQLEVKNL